MASIKKRADGKYRARYRDDAGKEHARHFERKVDAQRWLDSVAADRLTGNYVDPTAGRVTFGQYAQRWREVQVHRPSTAEKVESHLRLHVLPVLGGRPMAAIRPSDVQALVKGLDVALAPATVEVVYRYVSTIFRAAVDDRVIPRSPCSGVRLPSRPVEQVQPLATEAVHRLIDAMPERYRATVVVAAGCGLRQGEVLGLTVDRIDFLRRQVVVDRQLVATKGAGVQLAPTKTAASVRTVPLPQVVAEALAQHLERFEPGPDRLVFTTSTGRPVRRNVLADAFRRAAIEAELPAGTGFHALRHYYASLLIRQGASVKVVQARLGHASAVETLNTYSHLWPDDEDRTRAAVDAVLGATGPVATSTSSVGG